VNIVVPQDDDTGSQIVGKGPFSLRRTDTGVTLSLYTGSLISAIVSAAHCFVTTYKEVGGDLTEEHSATRGYA
jgi:hypothetical protein